MSINAKCPVCGQRFRRPDGLAGKLEKCPECRHVFRLPTTESPSLEEERAAVENSGEARTTLPKSDAPAEPPPPSIEDIAISVAVSSVSDGIPFESQSSDAVIERFSDAVEISTQPAVEPIEEVEVSEFAPVESVDELTLPLDFEPFSSDEASDVVAESLEEKVIDIRDGREASREIPRSVEYATIAAVEVCSGKVPGKVEAELIRQGMRADEARLLMEDMFSIRKRLQQEKKSGMGWLYVFGGLMLMGLCGAAVIQLHRVGKSSDMYMYAAASFAAVGTVLVVLGIGRLIFGGAKVDVKTLVAAHQKRE